MGCPELLCWCADVLQLPPLSVPQSARVSGPVDNRESHLPKQCIASTWLKDQEVAGCPKCRQRPPDMFVSGPQKLALCSPYGGAYSCLQSLPASVLYPEPSLRGVHCPISGEPTGRLTRPKVSENCQQYWLFPPS